MTSDLLHRDQGISGTVLPILASRTRKLNGRRRLLERLIRSEDDSQKKARLIADLGETLALLREASR